MTIQLTGKWMTAETGLTAPAPGPLSVAWQRVRAAIADMNYASRRIVEVQAPWFAGQD